VDAITGRVVHHLDLNAAVTAPQQISGGHILRACNLSAGSPCTFPSSQETLEARPGDIIDFEMRLHDPAARYVPFARVFVDWGPADTDRSRVVVGASVEWSEPPGLNHAQATPVTIILPKDGPASELIYIPGSTQLFGRAGPRLALLPDGISDGGITIARVGPPEHCFDCDLEYLRFIEFRARLAAI
jgi:hypothetical protein